MKDLEVRSNNTLVLSIFLSLVQSELSEDLSNFKAIDSLLQDVYSTLQVSLFAPRNPLSIET